VVKRRPNQRGSDWAPVGCLLSVSNLRVPARQANGRTWPGRGFRLTRRPNSQHNGDDHKFAIEVHMTTSWWVIMRSGHANDCLPHLNCPGGCSRQWLQPVASHGL
jgi:hypothetical protein